MHALYARDCEFDLSGSFCLRSGSGGRQRYRGDDDLGGFNSSVGALQRVRQFQQPVDGDVRPPVFVSGSARILHRVVHMSFRLRAST
jgi:hypothetical protein